MNVCSWIAVYIFRVFLEPSMTHRCESSRAGGGADIGSLLPDVRLPGFVLHELVAILAQSLGFSVCGQTHA